MERSCSTHAETKNSYEILFGKLKERGHFGDVGVDGRIY